MEILLKVKWTSGEETSISFIDCVRELGNWIGECVRQTTRFTLFFARVQ